MGKTLITWVLLGGAALGQSLQSLPPVQIPGTAGAGVGGGLGTPLALTLRDAIERALKDNLDIRVERYDLEIPDLRISETRGAYDPQAGFSVGRASSSTPTTSVLQGGGIATETASSQTFGP